MIFRLLLIAAFILSRGMTKVTAVFIGFLLLLQGCDDEETGDAEVEYGSAQPPKPDFLPGDAIANNTTNTLIPGNGGNVPARGNDDWSTLGANANQNQWAFRQQFGLSDPTSDQLASWQQYDARLTAYSNKDSE